MKRSVKYWIMRAAALEAALQNDAADVAEYSINAYNRAIEKINADIRRVYDNLGKVTGLNDDELRQIVSAAEHDELYRDLVKQYKETLDPEKKKELADRINAQAYGARISRLEMIKSRVYVEMIKAANLAHAAQKRFYEDVFQETYYTEIYNRVKGANIGIDFSVLPKRAIELALNEPWHGYNYSERVSLSEVVSLLEGIKKVLGSRSTNTYNDNKKVTIAGGVSESYVTRYINGTFVSGLGSIMFNN